MKAFGMKTEIVSGINALAHVKAMPSKKVFLVTDETMVSIGVARQLEDHLKSAGTPYYLFQEVEANPKVETVKKGLKLMVENRVDTLIALGGGSVIDAAKAMMYFCIKSKEMLVDKDAIHKPRFIAIPTTSGTGSEVTSFSVITDEETQTKVALTDPLMLPDIAILDATLTLSVPPAVTADTGMDVITHALEAYMAKRASEFSQVYAEKSLLVAFDYLVKAYQDGSNREARQKMHEASCMAGLAFTNAGLGINHSLAHAIGGRFKISHGRANAILLPHIIAYNAGLTDKELTAEGEAYGKLATQLGIPDIDAKNKVKALVRIVERYRKELKIEDSFRSYGIDENEYKRAVESMAAIALKDVCTNDNPREVTQKELEILLLQSYSGELEI